MARVDFDWKVLRGAFVLFVCALAISVTLIWLSQRFAAGMRASFDDNNGRFRFVSGKYLAVDDEARIIEDFLPVFQRYYAEGIIGTERRLDWIATLREADQAIGLPELKYDIDSQQLYQADFPLALDTYDLYASHMRLSAGLLHEGDFVAVLNALDRDAPGTYTVSHCVLERAAATLDLSSEHTNVTVECDVVWLTLKLRGGRDIEL
ncbi:MAG: hypothetical protein H6978_11775 [Gammaproteobacteria bacterium]|nr:hypothetical protein [Gammaproteobacteria bacterium]